MFFDILFYFPQLVSFFFFDFFLIRFTRTEAFSSPQELVQNHVITLRKEIVETWLRSRCRGTANESSLRGASSLREDDGEKPLGVNSEMSEVAICVIAGAESAPHECRA